MILANFIRRFFCFRPERRDSLGRIPRDSWRLRTVEGKTEQESEEAAEGEAEKNESDRRRGIAWILIPTPLLN